MRFRLQFSLRMLLLLMAVVAVGLAIFRWPWAVITVIDYETRTTTLRRAWNGVPLKHGRAWTVDNVTGRTIYEANYVENQLTNERVYDATGALAEDHSYYWRLSEHSARDYTQLAKHGFILEKYQAKTLVWHKWKTPDGTVLESHGGILGDYGTLTLQEWNGRLFADEMQRVLADLPTGNDRLAWGARRQGRALMGPGAILGDWTYLPFINKNVEPVPFCSGLRTSESHIRFDELDLQFREGNLLRGPYGAPIRPKPQSAFHDLLVCAHQRNSTLRVRFGIVTVVPIGPELLQSDDPTGALAVEFPAGSAQAQAWLEPVVHMRLEIASAAARVEQFFAGTGIEVDTSQLKLPNHVPAYLTSGTYLRPRRDVFGTFLLTNNYRIEQQGNRLVLLPH